MKRVTTTQTFSERQIEKVLRHRIGNRVQMFTANANLITGRIRAVKMGLITLSNAKVTGEVRVRLANAPVLRVATSQITSFQVTP